MKYEELAGPDVVVDPADRRSSARRIPVQARRSAAAGNALPFGSPPRSLRAAAVLLAVLAAAMLLATFVVAFWLWQGELVATPPAVVFFCLFALLPVSIVSLLWAAARAVWHGRSWGLSLAAGICVLSVIGAGFLVVDFGYRSVVGLTIDAASWWLLLVVAAVMLLGSIAAVLLRRLRYNPFVLAGGIRGMDDATMSSEAGD
ncbi:hypothetical protein [Actinoalloteichus hymeniacidonis]|nr:hypothetical protein [Actinoalloteichus hymeniacidonis]MBB5910820.1 uncharacterized protein (DUF983 family) [Actinoalloteichus hymeniacidonis]